MTGRRLECSSDLTRIPCDTIDGSDFAGPCGEDRNGDCRDGGREEDSKWLIRHRHR